MGFRPTGPRRVASSTTALLLAVGLAGCGGSGSTVSTHGPTAGGPPAPVVVFGVSTIKNSTVSPGTLRVQPGETIRIVNSDSVAHELADGKNRIDSGNIKAGGTATLAAPDRTGTFKLTDSRSAGMHLTVVVG